MLVAAQAFGKAASIPIDALVESSELIIVARVETVSRSLLGKRHARAKVLEVWKGAETENVEFLAAPTWTCDISDAIEGEVAVLFLVRDEKARGYTIAHSGRGRMPVRLVDGESYAAYWPEVKLPEETSTIDGPEPQWSFIRSVAVATLRDLVER